MSIHYPKWREFRSWVEAQTQAIQIIIFIIWDGLNNSILDTSIQYCFTIQQVKKAKSSLSIRRRTTITHLSNRTKQIFVWKILWSMLYEFKSEIIVLCKNLDYTCRMTCWIFAYVLYTLCVKNNPDHQRTGRMPNGNLVHIAALITTMVWVCDNLLFWRLPSFSTAFMEGSGPHRRLHELGWIHRNDDGGANVWKVGGRL